VEVSAIEATRLPKWQILHEMPSNLAIWFLGRVPGQIDILGRVRQYAATWRF
jgi:hypothetical protein